MLAVLCILSVSAAIFFLFAGLGYGLIKNGMAKGGAESYISLIIGAFLWAMDIPVVIVAWVCIKAVNEITGYMY